MHQENLANHDTQHTVLCNESWNESDNFDTRLDTSVSTLNISRYVTELMDGGKSFLQSMIL